MLLILSLVFAGFSLIVLIIGGVWTLIRSGKTTRRTGPAIGAEIMNSALTSDDEGLIGVNRSTFVGKAVAVEREATIDFADLKAQFARGDYLSVFPALLAIGGFVGVLFFGALAVFFAIPGLISGAVMLSVFYILVRMLIAFIRA